MLAQNFMTAADLSLTGAQKAALIKVLVLLETGRLEHHQSEPRKIFNDEATFCGKFNMEYWTSLHHCGTVACIGGTAQLVGNVDFEEEPQTAALQELFSPQHVLDWSSITTDQAAVALRSYLTTGDARWDLAVTTG
jgi:hypothetical protein